MRTRVPIHPAFGYAIAVMVSTMVFITGIAARNPSYLVDRPSAVKFGMLFVAVIPFFVFIFASALVPFMMIHILSKKFDLQKFFHFVLFGSLVGVALTPVCVGVLNWLLSDDNPPNHVGFSDFAPVVVLAACAGAAVYWWVSVWGREHSSEVKL